MKEFDTYVFDLDGTLLETLNDLAASTNYALRTNNFPEHTAVSYTHLTLPTTPYV